MKREKKNRSGNMSTLLLITQIAIGMLTPIALCAVGGYFLCKKLELGAAFFILLLFLGIAAGYRNVWMMVRKYTKDEKPEEPVKEQVSEAEAEFRKWKERNNRSEDRSVR